MSKINLFEYFLKKLVDWHCEYHRISYYDFTQNNDFSKLKVIKLHFFACSTSDQAIDFFDCFHAMPYGHVESEVYNHLSELHTCKVLNNKLDITDEDAFLNLSVENQYLMEGAVEKLKVINPDLISLNPFELVDLSHKWYSLRMNYNKARQLGVFSRPIDPSIIKKEEKFYFAY